MKVFTLEEARNLLIKIKPIVEDINIKKSELYEFYSRLEDEQDELEKMYYQTKVKELESLIKHGFLRIEEFGGVIKGVDPILIDFLSYHEGRYIWLCWKEDEETIMFWHELNDGFAGRKPVDYLEGSERLL
ncbi:hypothetical protein BCF55_1638 [Hydrogenivirga caldilitoris]|uniref:DUF2203 family protein n=1 Tax=Hydrogenivirga caldilitoris TaxID=246264 RepID=A0A497XTC7_9AQUI|nr:DUF2203 domain-containing protein [Hydrogenivirga caldilitoris]RLJ71339.1 hypothetical protein BCF55_1638 [Hydrogenivirga caldilitoris]